MLILTHDRQTRKTVFAAGANCLHRGHAEGLTVFLLDDGAASRLATGEVLKLVAKPRKQRDTARLFLVTVEPADFHENSGSYRKAFATLTDPINALFKAGDGDDANDITSVTVEASIVLVPDGGGAEVGDTFDLVIENTPYNAEDASPETTQSPDDEWVAHGHSQSLSDEARARARSNLEAAGLGDLNAGLEQVVSLQFWDKGDNFTLESAHGDGRSVIEVQQFTEVMAEVVCTLPDPEDVFIQVNRPITIKQTGTSAVIIQPAAHDPPNTLNGSTDPITIAGRWKSVTLYKRDGRTWRADGAYA